MNPAPVGNPNLINSNITSNVQNGGILFTQTASGSAINMYIPGPNSSAMYASSVLNADSVITDVEVISNFSVVVSNNGTLTLNLTYQLEENNITVLTECVYWF